MPPPGVRFIRDNGNGSSQWQGPGGAVVDVHHEAPGMEQFRPPQQQIAQVGPQQSTAPVGTQAPAPAQSTMADYNMSYEPSAVSSPAAPAPVPMSVGAAPVSEAAVADARIQAERAYGRPQRMGQSPGLMSTGDGAIMSDPDAEAVVAAQRTQFDQANQPTTQPTFATGAGGAGGRGSSGAVASPFIQGRGSPRTSAMVPSAVSETVQSGARLPDGTIEGVQAGSEAAAQAAENTGKNERQELAQNAQTLADRNRIVGGLGGLMDQSVADEQGRGDRMNQARLNFEDIASRARSMTVDPDRRSGGDRITGAIASLLGGIGSGITGGPNHAVQIIQHAIDRDVEAQRSNVANAQHGTAAAQTAYQLARDQGASEREAEAMHMGFEYRRAADEMERLAALTGSSEAIDEARIRAEELRAHGAQLIGTLAHNSGDRTSVTTQSRRVNSGGPGRRDLLVQQTDNEGNYIAGSDLVPLSSLPAAAQTAVINGTARNLRLVSGVGGGGGELDNASRGQVVGVARHTAQAVGALNQVQRFRGRLSEFGTDGLGLVAGRIPRPLELWFGSPEGLRNRQSLQSVALPILYALSGKQTNEAEVERINGAYRLVASSDPTEFLQGLSDAEALLSSSIAAERAALSGDQVGELDRGLEREGLTITRPNQGNSSSFTPVGGRR